jgi:lantibiotic modifying enzyme
MLEWIVLSLSISNLSPLTRAIAETGVDRLRNNVTKAEKYLADSAWRDFARHLEWWLLILLRSALSTKVAIAVFRDGKKTETFSRNLGVTASNLSLQEFFQLLPGAKETVDLVVKDWVRAQRLMLTRLERDRKSLSSIVSDIANKPIKHITPGLSDPHDRGQTVTILQFANGPRIVYKPRACEGERIWFSALQWLNENGFRPGFQIPKLIARGNYCWMSFVGHRACKSKQAVRRFYFRWGAQAAIAQLLGCADLHRQNWIAAGEHPVLIDGEMIGDAFSPCSRHAVDRHLHPLLRTGLLPIFESDGVGRYDGIAPFDSSGRRKEQNVFWPIYRGRAQQPDKYVNEIADGFKAAACFICHPRNRKRFKQFILQAARRKNLRLLKRATVQYRQILDESLHPYYLQKRGDRVKYLLERCGGDQIEADCLVRCSVPRFTTRLNPKAARSVPALGVMLDSAKLLHSRIARGRIK